MRMLRTRTSESVAVRCASLDEGPRRVSSRRGAAERGSQRADALAVERCGQIEHTIVTC